MKKILILFFLSLSAFVYGQAPELIVPVGHKEIVGIYDIDVSSDQSLAASVADKVVKIWDYQSGRLLKTFTHPSGNRFSRAKFLPDNKTLVLTGDDGRFQKTITLLSTETFQVVKEFRGDLGTWCLQLSSDGRIAYTGDFNLGKITRVDLTTGSSSTLYEMPGGTGTQSLSLSPDGSHLLAMVSKGKYSSEPFVSVMISTSGQVEKIFPENVQYQSFTPRGNLFRLAMKNNESEHVAVYTLTWANARTGQEIGHQDVSMNAYYPSHAESLTRHYEFFPNSDRAIFSVDKNQWIVAPTQAATAISFTDPRFNSRSISPRAKYLKLVGENEWMTGTEDNFIYKFNLKNNQLIEEYGLAVFAAKEIYSAPQGKAFAIAGDNDWPYVFSYAGGRTVVKQVDANINTVFVRETCINVSPDGTLTAYGASTEVRVVDTRTPAKIIQRFPVPNASHLAISPDNNLIVVTDTRKNIFVANLRANTVTPMGAGDFYDGAISDDNRYFIGLRTTQKNDTLVSYFDLTQGKKLWEITDSNHALGRNPFIFDRNEVGFIDFRNRKVVLLKTADGSLSREPGYASSIFDGKTILKNKFSLEEFNRANASDGFWQSRIVDRGGYYLRSYDDNTVKIYHGESGRKVGEIILSAKTGDWAIVAPDGRFDASEGMMKALYYRRGRDLISLGAISEKFYTPNLLGQLLSESPAPTPDPKKDDIKNLKLPPIARIAPPVDVSARNLTVEDDKPALRKYSSNTGRIKLTVEANSVEDAVSEIRLYHNGKSIGTGTRNLTVEDDKVEKKKILTYEIQLSDGDNIFRAVAIDTQRSESQPAEIIVTNKIAVQQIAQTRSGSTLHLIVVGINQYKNPKYNLNYATADAAAFKTAIENVSSGLFEKVNAIYVGDAQATKSGITTELEKVKASAQPQDVFIFYYAGHGVMNEKKEFYFVPYDVTQLYGADEALAQKGISAAAMQQFSREIKAQKQLFILDACQSAAALDNVAFRGAAEEKAIAQLARATGTHWLTASGSEQFAAEFKQLGHGTFTYVLLEALSGKADKSNDSKITVKKLDAYLQEVVPELTAKYRGAPQYPASYGYGNDFPIGVVKAK